MTDRAETGLPLPPAPPALAAAPVRPGRLREFWGSFSVNLGAVVGLGFIVFIVFVAIFAPLLAPYGFAEQFRDVTLEPPSWLGGDPRFFLGTDYAGRDILSRIIFGSRFSLLIGVVVVSLALVVGVTLGLIAGFFGGWVDVVISRVMDVILSFPSLLLALALVAILGPGLMNAMIGIAVVLQPHFVRMTRAAVLSERGRDYVTSARLAGAGKLRLMFVTILPNTASPLIVQAALSFSTAILEAAALGYLGVGAQVPTPEWGAMLADSRDLMESAWWVVTFPGIAILLTVLAINLMGDGLRDALDPRLRKS